MRVTPLGRLCGFLGLLDHAPDPTERTSPMSRQFSSFLLDIEHAPEAFIQAHLGNPEPCKALWAAADGYKHDGKFDVSYQTTLDDVFTMLNNDYVNTRSFSVGDVLVEWVWYQWPADE